MDAAEEQSVERANQVGQLASRMDQVSNESDRWMDEWTDG